mmetsp:Transcript_8085/g.22510  ORF Transcript_8085/g.22510 Transcript_8085/m.22510 type:complete len:214 (+) Transcript_8085:1778-2419(+)
MGLHVGVPAHAHALQPLVGGQWQAHPVPGLQLAGLPAEVRPPAAVRRGDERGCLARLAERDAAAELAVDSEVEEGRAIPDQLEPALSDLHPHDISVLYGRGPVHVLAAVHHCAANVAAHGADGTLETALTDQIVAVPVGRLAGHAEDDAFARRPNFHEEVARLGACEQLLCDDSCLDLRHTCSGRLWRVDSDGLEVAMEVEPLDSVEGLLGQV